MLLLGIKDLQIFKCLIKGINKDVEEKRKKMRFLKGQKRWKLSWNEGINFTISACIWERREDRMLEEGRGKGKNNEKEDN